MFPGHGSPPRRSPRKPGARTKSGRLSQAHKRNPQLRDHGTPEAQAKRLALVNGSGNHALAFTLPDVLLAWHIISPAQHTAAWKLRRARAAVFGVPLENREPGRVPDDEQIRRNERRYAAMLGRLSPDQALAVVDLILDLRSPWIRRAVLELHPAEGDEAERQTLLSGLDALAGATGERWAA
jgi:hypothetical protein